MGLLEIDGSFGEGGGQVLRTSLTLSMCTGTPFRITNIRASRKKPGLLRQHLTCVLAAQRISNAEVEGATLRSSELTFRPGPIVGGEHHFEIGSAGSTTLVLQTVIPALFQADGPSKVIVGGGTHNMMAPPFDFLDQSVGRVMRSMGAGLELHLDRIGFFPAGGGVVRAEIKPSALKRLEILERGPLISQRALARVSKISPDIAERELKKLRQRLRWPQECFVSELVTDSPGPGNVLVATLEYEHVTAVMAAFGRIGLSAERVAGNVVQDVQRFEKSAVPVGEYLADQLMLPVALAGGGAYRSVAPSLHSKTNAQIIAKFLPLVVSFKDADEGGVLVTLAAR